MKCKMNVMYICMNIIGWKINTLDVYECKWLLTYAGMQGGDVPEYKTKIAIGGSVRRDEKWGLVSVGWRSLLLYSIHHAKELFILILQRGCNTTWHGRPECKCEPFA